MSRTVRLPQHPDEHRPERPVLLAVDQQLGEGPRLRVPSELADPIGSVEVGEHQDVEQARRAGECEFASGTDAAVAPGHLEGQGLRWRGLLVGGVRRVRHGLAGSVPRQEGRVTMEPAAPPLPETAASARRSGAHLSAAKVADAAGDPLRPRRGSSDSRRLSGWRSWHDTGASDQGHP